MQRRKFLSASTVAVSSMAASQLDAKAYSISSDKKGFIVKAGDSRTGQHTPFMGTNPNDLKISSKDTDGQLCVFEYIGTPKVGPVLHLHFHQDEIFYVVEGEYLFQLGTEKHKLKAGDTIFLPRAIPHTWVQLSDKGKLIYLLQPAGKFEEFVTTMNSLKGRPTEEDLQKLSLAHGMKNVGPPLQAE